MLKKRLVGVVTVKNGWAVQSFGYNRYLPLGKPECLVENLDRWGADEILIQVIDRSVLGSGPDFELLEKLACLGLGTPLIYGGGISSVEEGINVIQSGADRLIVDSLLHDDLSIVKGLSEQLGAQAVIASIPMNMGLHGPEWFDYRSRVKAPFGEALGETIEQGVISEVLLTDWQHEGSPEAFDTALVDLFPYKKVPLIVFGGISSTTQMKALLSYDNVVGVSVGNFLNYQEHAIQKFKEALDTTIVRPPIYATEYST
jgi:imidazole glycerol-phosphate synthase subunit HisF